MGGVIVLGTHYSCMLSVVWCVSEKDGVVSQLLEYTIAG